LLPKRYWGVFHIIYPAVSETMNSQFRSNLMRQIVATARHQARPPAALLGWINELDSNNTNDSADAAGSSTAADSSSFIGYGRGTASTSASAPAPAPAAAGVLLRRRISPGGREYNEYLPPIHPSSTRSEVANSSIVAAVQQQNPAMASSALGTATPTAPDGSPSLFALPAAAASESGAGSARSTQRAQAAAPTTADRGGGPVEEEDGWWSPC
jgi:hypothetical protein